MEDAIINVLLTSDNVRAIVADRVTPGRRDQGSALPAIVFTRIDGAPGLTHAGPEGSSESRIQIDAYGETYASAKAAAHAARTALHGYRNVVDDVELMGVFLESERDAFEGEAPDRIHRVSMDFTVWAVEA